VCAHPLPLPLHDPLLQAYLQEHVLNLLNKQGSQ